SLDQCRAPSRLPRESRSCRSTDPRRRRECRRIRRRQRSRLRRVDPRRYCSPAGLRIAWLGPPQLVAETPNSHATPPAEPIRLLAYSSPAILAKWSAATIKSIFTLRRHHAFLSVVGPASPTASPESES